MPVPSNPQDLINIIREKLFNNTSGLIEEPDLREVLENIVKVLDAKFSMFSPTLTEEQYSQWNLMLDYMLRETKGVLTTSSSAPTGNAAIGKYLLSGAGTYTNLGGLVAAADKLNYAYFDGTSWSKVEVAVPSGKSAYEVAVANGFVGTEAEWLASLDPDPQVLTMINQISDFEGYVQSNLDWAKAESKITANYTTGFVRIYTGSVVSYPAGAISKTEDKTKLVKLLGGGVYSFSADFLTINTAQVLVDENLNPITYYAVANNKGVNDNGKFKCTIDLTDKEGVYYLLLSLRFANNTIDFGFTITNNSFFKTKRVSNSSLSTAQVIKNDLITQLSSINNLASVNGTYGNKDASYTILNPKVGSRVSVKFKFRNDINTGTLTRNPFVKVLNNTTLVDSAGTIKAKPTVQTQAYSTDIASYIPHPKYNSGYYAGSNDFIVTEDKKAPIIGEKLFMIWLKGKRATVEPTEAELTDRSTDLGTKQDYSISIVSDVFSIIRDGIGTDGNTFNGGATSVIYTTSLKTAGTYKTLQEFYEELKTATNPGGVLADFYLEFFNLSSRLTCESLLQFDKVKLVGKYRQQVKQNTGNTDPTFGYYYDSYPFYFQNKIDYKEHILDVLTKDSSIDFYIDGVLIGSTAKGDRLQFGGVGTDVYFYDAKHHIFDLGDAEVITAGRLMSSSTPYVIGLMGHGFVDDYEHGVKPPENITQTLTRLADVTKLIVENGYTLYSAKDIADWSVGKKKLNKRAAYFMFDDYYAEIGYMDNIRLRNSYVQFGGVVNFAIIMNTYYTKPNKDLLVKKFASMRLNGHDIVNHSKYHEVPMPQKNSIALYYELEQMQVWADEMHVNPNFFVYNWSGAWIPTANMLEIKGFNCAANSSGNYSNNMTNKYFLGRINIADSSSWASMSRIVF